MEEIILNAKDIVKNNKRYKDFTVLDPPIPLNEFLKKDVSLIQIHCAIATESFIPELKNTECDIIGFVGVMKRINGELLPDDGDTYNSKMKVLAYNWFEHEGVRCLDVLAGDDW